MRQVLFHIPLKADWLPANFPFPLFVLLVGLVLAAAAWLASRRAGRPAVREGLRVAASWLALVGALAAGAAWFFAGRMPEGLPIYGYGMMLFLGFLICTLLAGRRAEREGIPHEYLQDVCIWMFVGGLVGARFVFLKVERGLPLGEVIRDFYRVWDGGIVLYGAVIGGVAAYLLAYLFVLRKYRLSTRRVWDVMAPYIALYVCLGRFGCFLNGCCYGQVACPDCPVYAVHFPLSAPPLEGVVGQGYQTAAGFTLADDQPRDYGARVGQVDPRSPAAGAGLRPGDLIVKVNECTVQEGVLDINGRDVALSPVRMLHHCLLSLQRGQGVLRLTVQHAGEGQETELPPIAPRTVGLHPTQLYEVVSMFLLFLLVLAYYPFRRREGQAVAVVMFGYGLHRYLNELLRDDPRPKGFEAYISILLILCGLALWTYLQVRPAPPGETKAAAPSPA